MDLPEELTFESLSLEEKNRRAVSGYMKRLSKLYEAIHARFGEDGLELIRDVSREYGTAIGLNVRKKDGKCITPWHRSFAAASLGGALPLAAPIVRRAAASAPAPPLAMPPAWRS